MINTEPAYPNESNKNNNSNVQMSQPLLSSNYPAAVYDQSNNNNNNNNFNYDYNNYNYNNEINYQQLSPMEFENNDSNIINNSIQNQNKKDNNNNNNNNNNNSNAYPYQQYKNNNPSQQVEPQWGPLPGRGRGIILFFFTKLRKKMFLLFCL